jgi:DNA-directed RNA polymerase specialized sigma24 family protein
MVLLARPDAELTFRGAWETLPPAEREVIETIVRGSLSLTRCATRLGLDVEDVRRLTVQGMRRLRTANEIDRASTPGVGDPPTTSLVGRAGLEPATDGA